MRQSKADDRKVQKKKKHLKKLRGTFFRNTVYAQRIKSNMVKKDQIRRKATLKLPLSTLSAFTLAIPDQGRAASTTNTHLVFLSHISHSSYAIDLIGF